MKRFFGNVHEFLRFWCNFSYREGTSGVTIKAFIHDAHVKTDDVSFLKDAILGRKTMNDLLVHRTAKGIGKTLIPEKCRANALLFAARPTNLLEKYGRNTRTDILSNLVENTGNNTIGLTHEANLFFVFEEDTPEFLQGYLPFPALPIKPSY